MTAEELTHWSSGFVMEVRKTDRKEYLPTLCTTLLAVYNSTGVTSELFKDLKFSPFRASFDGEMKHQVEVITPEEEEKLWQSGQLGD